MTHSRLNRAPSSYADRPGRDYKMATRISINVPSPAPFDETGDPSSLFPRWKKWLKTFLLFSDANGCTDDAQKKQLLLYTAGESVQDIFSTLNTCGKNYEDVENALTVYFKPVVNIPFERHRFRNTHQRDGETVTLALCLMTTSVTNSLISVLQLLSELNSFPRSH